jgi:hypothetical protein
MTFIKPPNCCKGYVIERLFQQCFNSIMPVSLLNGIRKASSRYISMHYNLDIPTATLIGTMSFMNILNIPKG